MPPRLPPLAPRYGPDTYMGRNLQRLLGAIADDAEWDDARIARELHPAHTRASLRDARRRLDVFEQGHCAVHHMFGSAVARTIASEYADAFVTAHLEVRQRGREGERERLGASRARDCPD